MLTYHSVDNTGSVISITPKQFRQQMKFLYDKGYETITLPELVNDFHRDTEVPKKHVVLTFDDGFMNNYEFAFPILQEFGMNATIFVVTDLIGKLCTWGLSEGFPETPLMSWREIKELHRYGIDIQPHSCTHPHLTSLADDRVFDEVSRSKENIQETLAKAADVFCYPYGTFNEKVIRALKKAGYVAAVTTMFGRNFSDQDPYKLRRIGSAHFTSQTRFRFGLYPGHDLCVMLKNGFTRRRKGEDIAY